MEEYQRNKHTTGRFAPESTTIHEPVEVSDLDMVGGRESRQSSVSSDQFDNDDEFDSHVTMVVRFLKDIRHLNFNRLKQMKESDVLRAQLQAISYTSELPIFATDAVIDAAYEIFFAQMAQRNMNATGRFAPESTKTREPVEVADWETGGGRESRQSSVSSDQFGNADVFISHVSSAVSYLKGIESHSFKQLEQRQDAQLRAHLRAKGFTDAVIDASYKIFFAQMAQRIMNAAGGESRQSSVSSDQFGNADEFNSHVSLVVRYLKDIRGASFGQLEHNQDELRTLLQAKSYSELPIFVTDPVIDAAYEIFFGQATTKGSSESYVNEPQNDALAVTTEGLYSGALNPAPGGVDEEVVPIVMTAAQKQIDDELDDKLPPTYDTNEIREASVPEPPASVPESPALGVFCTKRHVYVRDNYGCELGQLPSNCLVEISGCTEDFEAIQIQVPMDGWIYRSDHTTGWFDGPVASWDDILVPEKDLQKPTNSERGTGSMYQPTQKTVVPEARCNCPNCLHNRKLLAGLVGGAHTQTAPRVVTVVIMSRDEQ